MTKTTDSDASKDAAKNSDRARIEASVQHCYSTWGDNYYADYYGPGAPYPPVHVDLMRSTILKAGAKSVLDAGCGPASFLRHLTEDGLDLYGFDLTAEMVTEAKRIFAERGLSPDRVWQGSVIEPLAFKPPGQSATGYDAAVCVGVLPHIAAADDARVFANLHAAVRPGGTVLVEARNQLFSLFTLNRPSYAFVRDELVQADRLLDRAGTEREAVSGALDAVKGQFRMDLPPVRGGKAGEPGYDEVLSRTHNPLTLKPQFEAAGFTDVRVLFYHFHALPPMLEKSAPAFFRRESVAMEQPEDWRGYFMASAFLLCGVKA
jgi:2-polyprenyl-3-methyl-5-hydroxy-6-metoxy-1,4-benzoquinol methylase